MTKISSNQKPSTEPAEQTEEGKELTSAKLKNQPAMENDVKKPVKFSDMSSKKQALVRSMQELAKPVFDGCALVFCGPSQQNFVGTGTLVEHDGSLWIATAAHVAEHAIYNLPDARIAWISLGDSNYRDISLRSVALAWGASPKGDIAAILLNENARTMLKTATPIQDTQLSSSPKPYFIDEVVWLVGSPLALRDKARKGMGFPLAQVVMSMTTHVREKCHESSEHDDDAMGDYPRNKDLDFHVDWSQASQDGVRYEELFPAEGMSGSPLWSAYGPKNMWDTTKLKIRGIAWYHNRATQCIRVVPMGLWFEAADKCKQQIEEQKRKIKS